MVRTAVHRMRVPYIILLTSDRQQLLRNLEVRFAMSSALLKAALVIPISITALSLAIAGMAGAQTLRDYLPTPQPNSGNENTRTPFSQVLPSDAGNPPSGAPTKTQRHGRTTTLGGATTSGVRTPILCFQPGIGWLNISTLAAPQDHATAGNSSRSVAPGEGSNTIRQAAASGRLNSGARPPAAVECTAISKDTVAPGIGRYDFAGEYKSGLSNPAQSVGEHNTSRSLLEPWPTGTQVLEPSDPINTAAQIKALQSREYISPIRLRRLSRNAPDLESRLELRRIQNGLQKKPNKGATEEGRNHSAGPATVRHRLFSSNKPPCDRNNGRATSHAPCSRAHR